MYMTIWFSLLEFKTSKIAIFAFSDPKLKMSLFYEFKKWSQQKGALLALFKDNRLIEGRLNWDKEIPSLLAFKQYISIHGLLWTFLLQWFKYIKR